MDLENINSESLNLDNRQGTAKKAIDILVRKNPGYIKPNNKQRTNLLIAFAKKNKVVYGKAFDIIHIKKDELNENEVINLDDENWVESNLKYITICEIKSTRKNNIDDNFKKYFFGLTTAELLVAQSLKKQFKFVFVNIQNEKILELSLQEVFQRAKGIYPVWSIQF